jgi:hypothetical protein
MGFDLYGLAAKSKKGEYFRNNVWFWRPLAEYVLDNADIPDSEARDWDYNNGTQVSQETAIRIADMLDCLITGGHTGWYEEEYRARLAALPDEVCRICKGTGVRDDVYVKGTCNGCAGQGRVKNWMRNYPSTVENVQEFAKFCRESGGFEIW